MLSQSGWKHLKTIRAVFWMLSPIILVLISRNTIVWNYGPGRDGGTRRKRPALMWPLGARRAFRHQFHQSNLPGLKQINMYKVVGTGWCSHRILITQGLEWSWQKLGGNRAFTKSPVSAPSRESHRLYGATSTCRHIVVLLAAVANRCFPFHSQPNASSLCHY